MNEKNELIELFGQVFGEAIAKEITKYEAKHLDELRYSDDVKAMKAIVENATELILKEIDRSKKEIVAELDEIKLRLRSNDNITPWINPNPLRTDPWPWPYGPTVTYTNGDDPNTVKGTKTVTIPDLVNSIVEM